MQNKPNFPNAQIIVTSVLTKDYGNVCLGRGFKNKAKQTQFYPPLFLAGKPNLP
jgi:hypothetical protein